MDNLVGYNHPYYDNLVLSNNISDAARDVINSTHLNGVAGIKQTGDVGRDNLRETARVATDISHDIFNSYSGHAAAISELRSAVERTNGESRLSAEISANKILTSQSHLATELRGGINDNSKMILSESGRTREQLAAQHSAIQLQMCQDHAALAKGIAEICCCVDKQAAETRALILSTDTKRIETENANLRQDLLLAKLQASGPGNGGN